MTETGPGALRPDATAEAQAEEWVHEAIAQERAAERPADEQIVRDEGAAIEREEDAAGLNGLIGRIRATLRRR